MSDFYFNAHNVSPAKAFEPLPAGDYPVHIIEAEMKEPRNGGSKMVALTLEVLDGEYTGRRLWENLSIYHEKAQVADIAQRQLSAICRAINMMEVTDPQQLCFQPMIAQVTVTKRKDTGEWQNRATYVSIEGTPAPAAAPATAPRPAAAPQAARPAAAAAPRPGNGSTPPWRKTA